MNSSLWTARTGLEAQQLKLSVISNNISNVNTQAFKKSRVAFQDLLYQNIRQPGAQTTETTKNGAGLMLGTGVAAVSNPKDFSQGNLIKTEGDVDIAIQGRGFVPIQQADGTLAYTRDGSFTFNENGDIVTHQGQIVGNAAITVPQGSNGISIAENGNVYSVDGENVVTQIGQIQLFDFINPAGLQPVGQNLYTATASSGEPQEGVAGQDGFGKVLQGFLESSNVSVVEEMVNMIETQRAYELSSKAVSASDQMLKFLTQTL